MKTNKYILLCLAVFAIVSCGRVKPQGAANKASTVDSAALVMTFVNMRLAEEADRECTAYIQQTDTTFALDESGYWYTFTKRTNGTAVKKDDKVNVIFQSYRITGELIEDSEIEFTVGKRETLIAIDDILPTMHEGEEAWIVAPYYAAYGRDGKGQVEPYVNCIIYIRQINILE